MNPKKGSFEPGKIIVAPDALAVMVDRGVDPSLIIHNHLHSNWGTLDNAQGDGDNFFVSSLFSAQRIPGGEIWVTTTIDEAITKVELPF